ncbi:hypothetical protein ACIPV8_16615 [Streptomyces albidoflavus]
MEFLKVFYPAIFALSVVAAGSTVLAGVVLLVRPAMNPGRLISLFPIPCGRADVRVRALVHEAGGALNRLGIQHPAKWGEFELKVWVLAERGRRSVSLSLHLLCLITICAGGLLTVLVDRRWDMATELLLPSYAFVLCTVLYARIDLVATRRGSASAYLQWAAVSALVACQVQRCGNQVTSSTTVQLSRKVETVCDALTTYSQFGVSGSPVVRSVLLNSCAVISRRLESGLVACLCDRSRVSDLAEQVVELIDALARQEPLSVVSPEGVESVGSAPVEMPIPWRIIIGHFLVFLSGVGLILCFVSLGVGVEYLTLLAPLMYLVIQIPFLVTGKVPDALRHPPRLTVPFADPGSESEPSISGAGTTEDRSSTLMPLPPGHG